MQWGNLRREDSNSPETAGRTHASASAPVTMSFPDNPLPEGSEGWEAHQVAADSEAAQAEGLESSYSAEETDVGAVRRAGRQGLTPFGARSA